MDFLIIPFILLFIFSFHMHLHSSFAFLTAARFSASSFVFISDTISL